MNAITTLAAGMSAPTLAHALRTAELETSEDPVVQLMDQMEDLREFLDNELGRELRRLWDEMKPERKRPEVVIGYSVSDGREQEEKAYSLETALEAIANKRNRKPLFGPHITDEEWAKRMDRLECEWREVFESAEKHNKSMEDACGYTELEKTWETKCDELLQLENQVFETPATTLNGALRQAKFVAGQSEKHEFETDWLDGLIKGLEGMSS